MTSEQMEALRRGVELIDSLLDGKKASLSYQHQHGSKYVLVSESLMTVIASLSAAQALIDKPVGDGWKMVPVVPTDEMLDVACEHDAWTPSELWPIMVAAAPASPSLSQERDTVTAGKDGVVEKLKRLVEKLDEIETHGGANAAFHMAAIHGMTYAGPNYATELNEARAALAAIPAASERTEGE